MSNRELYVVGGGISCGKTEAINELDRRGHLTLPEAAKQIVDEGMAEGLTLEQIRGDEQEWQRKIFERILLNEARFDRQHPDASGFEDRGILDGLVFLALKGVEPGDYWNQVINDPRPRYAVFFSLVPLPEFKSAYFRMADEAAIVDEVTERTAQIYADFGIEVVRVPVMSIEERVDFMLAHIATRNAVIAA